MIYCRMVLPGAIYCRWLLLFMTGGMSGTVIKVLGLVDEASLVIQMSGGPGQQVIPGAVSVKVIGVVPAGGAIAAFQNSIGLHFFSSDEDEDNTGNTGGSPYDYDTDPGDWRKFSEKKKDMKWLAHRLDVKRRELSDAIHDAKEYIPGNPDLEINLDRNHTGYGDIKPAGAPNEAILGNIWEYLP